MFSAIAPTYDLLNHLLSCNLDRRWRKVAARALSPAPGERVLDLCTGTGDLLLALAKEGASRPYGCDFSLPMLLRAKEKAQRALLSRRLFLADALSLPIASGSFQAAGVAFGVRNYEDLGKGLAELGRVLQRGGRLAVLEFSDPEGPLLGGIYRYYFRRILPRIGNWVSGRNGPYSYLPATVNRFPSPPEFAGLLEQAGFEVVLQRPLTFGICHLHVARKVGSREQGKKG